MEKGRIAIPSVEAGASTANGPVILATVTHLPWWT
jgi:hypothetical protein